jgi:hypothetical protein
MTQRSRPYHLTAEECARLKRLRQVHTQETCAGILGRSTSAIERCEKRGFQPYLGRIRPRPADFALRASEMTIAQLRRHYRTNQGTVYRWIAEIGGRDFRHEPYKPSMPVPVDLREVVARLGPMKAARHYGVQESTLQRWREMCGLPVRYKRRTVARRKAADGIGWVDRFAAERRAQSRSPKENVHA